MELSLKNTQSFLDKFEHLDSMFIDEHRKNKLELFILRINANDFDYESLMDALVNPLIDFSLSRKVREMYGEGEEASLSKKARQKFIGYLNNKGELGELLLYCFLESHLGAPKLLSKLELKTSTSHYVNGADGVHFLELPEGGFQLIFGESKTIQDLTKAITDAVKSIYEFKNSINSNGSEKSGLAYEKSLISDHLEKEIFSSAEVEFIRKVIFPSRVSAQDIDDAFGVFIGYEVSISESDKYLPNKEFREKIKQQIKMQIKKSLDHIEQKIVEYELHGHSFYVYVLPFTDLNNIRLKIQKGITE